jgi:hypothetical protein
MAEVIPLNLFLVLFFGTLFFFVILLFVILILIFQREKKFNKETLFLPISPSFKEGAETMLKNELERAMREFGESFKTSLFQIISLYQKEVEKMSESVSLLAPELKNSLKEKTNEIFAVLEIELKKALSEIAKQNQQISQIILREVKEKLDIFGKEIEMISQETKKGFLEKKIEIEKMLENYKREKIKEVDEKIFQILADVSKKVLGKVIDVSTHEELVFRALKKAKEENFFEA